MRIARIKTPAGTAPAVARDDGWHLAWDQFDAPGSLTGDVVAFEDAELAIPVRPAVVVGMAHNTGPEDRKLPIQAFLKSARTAVGPGEPIVHDPSLGPLAVESELTVVFGTPARNLAPADVESVILGYTVGNDVTLPDQAVRDSKMVQVKNGDGFTPLGPWIETDLPDGILDGADLGLHTFADGVEVATGTIAGLAWTVREQIAYLTRHMAFGPGDVLLTGAPWTTYIAHAGEDIAMEVDGIGRISNPVVTA